jgi:hypothetical protein
MRGRTQSHNCDGRCTTHTITRAGDDQRSARCHKTPKCAYTGEAVPPASHIHTQVRDETTTERQHRGSRDSISLVGTRPSTLLCSLSSISSHAIRTAGLFHVHEQDDLSHASRMQGLALVRLSIWSDTGYETCGEARNGQSHPTQSRITTGKATGGSLGEQPCTTGAMKP